jgi:hypothetical protein
MTDATEKTAEMDIGEITAPGSAGVGLIFGLQLSAHNTS